MRHRLVSSARRGAVGPRGRCVRRRRLGPSPRMRGWRLTGRRLLGCGVAARGVSVGARVSELVDVGVSGLLLGPSGSDERVEELTDRLAGIGSERPALLGGGLVVDERTVDGPVDLLGGSERVGAPSTSERFSANAMSIAAGALRRRRRGRRGADPTTAGRSRAQGAAVRRTAAGRARRPAPTVARAGRRARAPTRDRAAHHAPAFRVADASGAAHERDRRRRGRAACRGASGSRRRWVGQRRS